MVDFAMSGDADVVVVQYLDRFGRNPREILRRIWEFQDVGIEVVTTDEDIREELVLLVHAGLARAESKRTSERVRAYMSNTAGKGVHLGRPPYGYRPIKGVEGTTWEQESGEAAAVREMYRLSLEENFGYKRIADAMHTSGYPTRGGRAWAAYTAQHILQNKALAGTLVYGKKPKDGRAAAELVKVPDFFPAILNQEEWARLQERLAIRRETPRGRSQSSEFLLSGIARCGYCGGPMVGKHGSLYKGRRYRRYYCSRAMTSRARCAYYNGHAAGKLEEAILEYLGQFSDPAKVREHLLAASTKEMQSKRTELRRVDRRLTALEADFQKNLDLLKRSILDEADFMAAKQKRKDERETLGGKRSELAGWLETQDQAAETASALPAKISTFVEDFGKLETRRAKVLLQPILQAVNVHLEGRLEIEFQG